jgi:hypothetical protein
MVIEIPTETSLKSDSQLSNVIKNVSGIVVIPPLENRPQWNADLDAIFSLIKESNTSASVIYLSSLYSEPSKSLEDEEPQEDIFKKLHLAEKNFASIAQKKKWAVLRTTFVQEFLLHYSKLIQETGSLLLPIAKAKCSYLSLADVSSSIWALIAKPKEFDIYTLTGPESIDGEKIADILGQQTKAKVSFSPIDPPFAKRYLRYELGDQAMALVDYYMAMFTLVKSKKLDVVTDDVSKITGKSPHKIDALFSNYAQLFKP